MAKVNNPDVSIDYIRRVFTYDPDEGILTRIQSVYNIPLGPVTYKDVYLAGRRVLLSRLIFAHYHGYWPEGLVDHANRIKTDNRIANLREVTHTQNQQNKVTYNPHGYKGVTWRDRKVKPWLSKIRVNGKRINLGSFATREEAGAAYEEACLKYHGKFAQLGC